jgi:DNA-directed RNA polymerase specialized sigma24 family protein
MAAMVIAALPPESNRRRRASATADSLVQQIDVLLPPLRRYRQGTDLRSWLSTVPHNLYVSDIRRAVGRA